uniref:PAZ domain-containing protein n=1 Tax=Elaeophora elaphi TaxID=1147741 RepID=A0A0R3RYM0_9BILA
MSRFSESDRYYIFQDVDRWDPITSFTRNFAPPASYPSERTVLEGLKDFKVESLFDYSLIKNGYNRKKIIQLDGIAPVIEGEDEMYFKGEACHLEYRRRTEGTVVETNCSMEVPIALTHYLRPHLKFDIVTTKTFLSMLCRFIQNERRFYRFNIERIGDLIIVEEAPFGDARPSKTYLQGALDILTGRASMDYRQLAVCEFGAKSILLRQSVDLVEPPQIAQILTRAQNQQSDDSQTPKEPFLPMLKETVASMTRMRGSIEQPDPIFHIDGTSVAIRGPLVPESPKKLIEVMCRSSQRFSFDNLQTKWPNMVFSGANRIVSVLHVRGMIDRKPKSFYFHEIAPQGYLNTMARASTLCHHILDYVKAMSNYDCEKVDDKVLAGDINDGSHLALYRRYPGRGFDDNSFVSIPLRTTILRSFH